MSYKRYIVAALSAFFCMVSLFSSFATLPSTGASPFRIALQQPYAILLLLSGLLAGSLNGAWSGLTAAQLYHLPTGRRESQLAWALSLLGFVPLSIAYLVQNQAFGPLLVESPPVVAWARTLYPFALAFDPGFLLVFAIAHLLARPPTSKTESRV